MYDLRTEMGYSLPLSLNEGKLFLKGVFQQAIMQFVLASDQHVNTILRPTFIILSIITNQSSMNNTREKEQPSGLKVLFSFNQPP